MTDDLGMMDLDLDSAVEAEIVPAGEYELEIGFVEKGTSKKGKGDFLHLVLNILNSESENPSPIHHYLMIPDSNQDSKTNNDRKLGIKHFVEACGLDSSEPVDLSTLEGLTCHAKIKVSTDPEYGEQNNVARDGFFVTE